MTEHNTLRLGARPRADARVDQRGTESASLLLLLLLEPALSVRTAACCASKLGSAALVSVFLPLRLVVAIVLSLFIVDDAPLAGALQICGTVLVLAMLAAYLVANRSVAAAERYEKAIVRTARQCACWARRRTDGEEEEDAEEGEEEERAAVELAAVAPVAQAMIVETDVARENTQ